MAHDYDLSQRSAAVHHCVQFKIQVTCNGLGKGKGHPRTGHEGTEEKRYGYTLSLTSVLDGGGWSMPHPGRFTPRKDPVPTA